MKLLFGVLLCAVCVARVYGQDCSTMNFRLRSEIPSGCATMTMTMQHDALDRPYLYVANKEAGLRVYDVSSPDTPALVANIPVSAFDTLDVMNLSQKDTRLYIALGNTFTNPQSGGMAIVDVTDPLAPVVTDTYVVPASRSGAGIVVVEGAYAYLGAMQSGLVVLDVSDPRTIRPLSQYIPDINFPPVPNPNPNLYNARGMDVRAGIVYLCYDAGGVRIIDCTIPTAPVEVGRWCNPVMYTPLNRPKAYNNAVLDDSLLYVAADYCGMEVLDVRKPASIRLHGWWNPYNCPDNNWFASPSHTNEMVLDRNCRRLFLSTGKSDMIVLDVSNPARPDSCNFYGGVSNDIGTWGIGVWRDQIYLSYICALVPFVSSWTGVRLLTYTPCTGSGLHDPLPVAHSLYPNPTRGMLTIEMHEAAPAALLLHITNTTGRRVGPQRLFSGRITFDTRQLARGRYYFHIRSGDGTRIVSAGEFVVE